MIHQNKRSPLMTLWLVLSLAACATPGKKTAIGAGVGAATGAAVGGAAEGWKGAAIGAAAGAALGGTVGNVLDKQTQELQQVTNAKRTREGILVQLKNDLLFDTGSAVLREPAVQNLSQLGEVLAKYPNDRIRIEGHTDNVGSKSVNETLSMRRAEAVKNVLIGQGVPDTRITALGLGKTAPIASNSTSKGREENRRVELHIEVPEEAKG